MPEWTQDKLKAFWRGLGWTTHEAVSTLTGAHYEDVWYDEKMECRMEGLSDPHDEDKVRLEVLLDGLERLAFKDGWDYIGVAADKAGNFDVGGWRTIDGEGSECWFGFDVSDRRTAIIAAIEKLEVKSEAL